MVPLEAVYWSQYRQTKIKAMVPVWCLTKCLNLYHGSVGSI